MTNLTITQVGHFHIKIYHISAIAKRSKSASDKIASLPKNSRPKPNSRSRPKPNADVFAFLNFLLDIIAPPYDVVPEVSKYTFCSHRKIYLH
jgi:hypothetical protein